MVKKTAIVISGEKIINLVEMNEKALSKTTENSIVWYLHENGRVLPLEPECCVKSIESFPKWIVIRTGDAGAKKSKEVQAEPIESDGLVALTNLIEKRKQEMPEGSYTTHLFSKGIDKIRKKTGEECIELILARTKDEITSEAADLVYHMMVLLSASGLSILNVLDELKRRES